MRESVKRISDRNFEERIEIDESEDEIGSLAELAPRERDQSVVRLGEIRIVVHSLAGHGVNTLGVVQLDPLLAFAIGEDLPNRISDPGADADFVHREGRAGVSHGNGCVLEAQLSLERVEVQLVSGSSTRRPTGELP